MKLSVVPLAGISLLRTCVRHEMKHFAFPYLLRVLVLPPRRRFENVGHRPARVYAVEAPGTDDPHGRVVLRRCLDVPGTWLRMETAVMGVGSAYRTARKNLVLAAVIT